MLEGAGYIVFNNAEAIRICDDKMLTHLSLSNRDIKMAKTINFPLKFFKDDEYEFFIDNVIKELGFPFVVKNSFGSLGEQVHLIHNKEEIMEYEKHNHMLPHIFQEYISSSFGQDFRLVTIGGKFISSMHRVAQDKNEFRSNIETGGIATSEKPPYEFIELAERISTILNLDYCGLDFMFDKDGSPIFNEINANAFFGPIEKFNPINVGEAYAKYIYQKIYVKS
jgi:ribosomal protein S6--L-glutamate ligase/gamma-F420-2:alpha-L-glutamate ligase